MSTDRHNSVDSQVWPEIVSKAVHDLRTPLSSIRTTLEIFRMIPGDSAKQAKLLGVLDKQVDELSNLLETLMENPATFASPPRAGG